MPMLYCRQTLYYIDCMEG